MPKANRNSKPSKWRLTEATTKFSENVLDATNAYELHVTEEAKLAGLPESRAIGGARECKTKGQRGMALHPPGAQLHRRHDISG